jgi:polar amino acid transport system substrate-binding protein
VKRTLRFLQGMVCGTMILASLAAAATPAPSVAAAVSTRTVTIGAEDDWPPYSFRHSDGQLQGITPRLVQAALKLRGIEVRYEVLPFSRCMRDATVGRLAACFNASITAENKASYQWHPTPLFVEELGIFAKKRTGTSALTSRDLEGKTVGITRGYTYPSEVTRNPRIRLVEASSDLQLMKLLQAGRLEFALLNTLPAYWRMLQEGSLKGQIERVGAVSQDGFWLAVSRKHPQGTELAREIEAGLQQLKASGEYERLMQKARLELIQ